jgi:hypothetical protein
MALYLPSDAAIQIHEAYLAVCQPLKTPASLGKWRLLWASWPGTLGKDSSSLFAKSGRCATCSARVSLQVGNFNVTFSDREETVD